MRQHRASLRLRIDSLHLLQALSPICLVAKIDAIVLTVLAAAAPLPQPGLGKAQLHLSTPRQCLRCAPVAVPGVEPRDELLCLDTGLDQGLHSAVQGGDHPRRLGSDAAQPSHRCIYGRKAPPEVRAGASLRAGHLGVASIVCGVKQLQQLLSLARQVAQAVAHRDDSLDGSRTAMAVVEFGEPLLAIRHDLSKLVLHSPQIPRQSRMLLDEVHAAGPLPAGLPARLRGPQHCIRSPQHSLAVCRNLLQHRLGILQLPRKRDSVLQQRRRIFQSAQAALLRPCALASGLRKAQSRVRDAKHRLPISKSLLQ